MPLDSKNFNLIGYLNFEPNPLDSNSRELKTIHLEITTSVIRLVVYDPYENR